MAAKKRNTKKRGRPATGQDPVTAIRLSKKMRTSVDEWARQQPDRPTRSEAIRQLVEQAISAAKPTGRRTATSSEHASAHAGRALDRMADAGATDEEQASRKRQLLEGPKEFRAMRKLRKGTP